MQTQSGPWDCHFCDSLTPSSTISNWPRIPRDSTFKVLSNLLPVFLSAFGLLQSLPLVWLICNPPAYCYQTGPHVMLKTSGGSHSSLDSIWISHLIFLFFSDYHLQSIVSFVLESRQPKRQHTFNRRLLDTGINEKAWINKMAPGSLRWPQWGVSFLYIKHIKIYLSITAEFLIPQPISK